MNSNNNPSINPADNDSLIGTMRFAFNKMLQDVNGMLPARVMAFDRQKNRVQVQPLIAVLTTDGSQVSRAQIASLPVLQIGGGNFMLNFNLKENDLGWILANDRDISLFLQSYSEAKPNTLRKNNFADSLFIPNILVQNYNIASEDLENAVLQSIDGKVKLSFGTDKIKATVADDTNTAAFEIFPDHVEITALGGLIVNGAITATGGLSVTGGGGFSITGNMNMTGNMTVTGDSRVIGDITASGDITPHVP